MGITQETYNVVVKCVTSGNKSQDLFEKIPFLQLSKSSDWFTKDCSS